MKYLNLLPIVLSLCIANSFAQHNEYSFYATMSLIHAEELAKEHPEDITILAKRRNEAAVFLTEQT